MKPKMIAKAGIAAFVLAVLFPPIRAYGFSGGPGWIEWAFIVGNAKTIQFSLWFTEFAVIGTVTAALIYVSQMKD